MLTSFVAQGPAYRAPAGNNCFAPACALQRYKFRIPWADLQSRYALAICLFAGRKRPLSWGQT
ncbi:hypothetical protein PSHT_10038 [Puccinia striiformis]|uniref:Uncharacterized protein n=1 Tax=Puccinia striiformis TaxID=27350 RepID=A0A2S4VCP6_9BASI|nr:hypothetical protein PSHT_10038 [Puccinia striiformis]